MKQIAGYLMFTLFGIIPAPEPPERDVIKEMEKLHVDFQDMRKSVDSLKIAYEQEPINRRTVSDNVR